MNAQMKHTQGNQADTPEIGKESLETAERNILRLIQDLRKVQLSDIAAGSRALIQFAQSESGRPSHLTNAAEANKLARACGGFLDAAVGAPTVADILGAYEALLDAADCHICLYRESAPDGYMFELPQVAMDQLQSIADHLGLWIKWFRSSAKPANYWRDTLERLNAPWSSEKQAA